MPALITATCGNMASSSALQYSFGGSHAVTNDSESDGSLSHRASLHASATAAKGISTRQQRTRVREPDAANLGDDEAGFSHSPSFGDRKWSRQVQLTLLSAGLGLSTH